MTKLNLRFYRILAVVVLSSALIAATGTVPAAGTLAFPETRAGEIARAYFEAFNSGDAEKLRVFEQEYRAAGALEKRPIDERIPRLLRLREQTGRLEPAEITVDESHKLSVTARAEKADAWISCTFAVEEEPPNKLISVTFMPGSAPAAEAAYVKEWKALPDLLEQIRAKTGVPALAAAIVEKGAITDVAVVGERRVGSGQAVGRDDRFHIGSITKSMTATMIAALVEKELIAWELTVDDVLGDIDMRDEYRNVTLEQLLQHRGGIPAYTHLSGEEEARLGNLPGSPTQQREAFAAEVLLAPPVAKPGTEMNYSNAGYTVAAVMAERVSSRSWEELVRSHVFEPAGMKTAGFGWPAGEDHPDQPRGHFEEGDEFRPREFGEYELGPYLAPAGGVHCSIEDLARYATVHLRGLAGRDQDFDADTIQRLHKAPTAAGAEMRYAAGWAIVDTPEVGEVHTHSGSAGTFFATIELYPKYDTAIVLATNVGIGAGTAVSKEITDQVKRRIAAKSGGQ
jgi:CubicO group peptidase (beta-lactamase class C family)